MMARPHYPLSRDFRKRAFSITTLCCCLVVVGCRTENAQTTSNTPATQKTTAVKTAPVLRQEIVPKTSLVGTVTAVQRSTVGSPVAGRVVRVFVEAGDEVALTTDASQRRIGQPIVQLDTESIDIQIAAGQAEQKRLEHELAELQAGSRPEEISRAKALWEAAKAASDFAESQFRRIEKLSTSNVVSTDDFENAQSAALEAKNRLIAARADYQIMENGPRQEQISQALAKLEQQKQTVSRLQLERSYHIIRAPFAGHIVRKATEVGQWVTQGSTVAEIVALDPIDIVVHAPESLVHQLRKKDAVPVVIAALPSGKEELTGVIQGIGPTADARARTFPVYIRLRNPVEREQFLLRAGMQAIARVSGVARSTLLVPKDALILGGPTPVVMIASEVAGGETVAVRVEVQVGVSRGDLVEVQGDLSADQAVVTSGNERLQAGQLLRITNSED